MLALSLLLVAAQPDDGLAKKMLPVYQKEVEDYSIALASDSKKALELKKEPIFEWSNPVRQGLQQGVIYLWVRDGRPAALACIFSQPHAKPAGRKVIHELHALDAEKLVVTRPKDALNEWKPEAGLARKELPDAGAPAGTPAARLIQMRKLASEFTGHMIDRAEKRWELRLLSAPLYRYAPAKTGIVDGALFALVSNAGTDPEVLVLIEAREEKGKAGWDYALGRFSDSNLYVQRKDKEVWSSVIGETNTHLHDPLHTYRLYGDKIVSLDGKLLARVQVTPEAKYGKIIPVDDK
jgi:hypothetical protein